MDSSSIKKKEDNLDDSKEEEKKNKMRDIDKWAYMLQEAEKEENGIASEDYLVPSQRIPLDKYRRYTLAQLLQKLRDGVESYEDDFTVKFVDMKTGKSFSNAVFSTRVDPNDDEIQIFFDFK